jgi:mono/diheme cytochrome c family protein
MNTLLKRTSLPAVALALTTLGAPGPAMAQNDTATTDIPPTRLLMPMLNSTRGRELFLSKGCVTCHSVNGVGGEDASALDAHEMEPFMNLFDLTAKMWTMAPVMIPAQEDELGDQIQLNGDELANIVAFLHDDVEQANLTLDSLSHDQREMMEEMAGVHDGGGEEETSDQNPDADQDQDTSALNSPHDAPDAADDRSTRLLMPQMSGERGRELFVSKGCVTCHSINGVGGDFGPSLDASGEAPFVSLFDMPARMWSKAPVMIPAQEDRLGEQIELTGGELADLVAFLNNDREQAMLTPFALEQ